MNLAVTCPALGYEPFGYFIAAFALASIIAGWGFFTKDSQDRKKAQKSWLIIFGAVFTLLFIVERLNQVDCFPG